MISDLHTKSPDTHGKEDSPASLPTLQIAEPGRSTAEIRAWALHQGCDVRRCGPLSNAVRRAYDEAHGGVERRDIQPPTKIASAQEITADSQ